MSTPNSKKAPKPIINGFLICYEYSKLGDSLRKRPIRKGEKNKDKR